MRNAPESPVGACPRAGSLFRGESGPVAPLGCATGSGGVGRSDDPLYTGAPAGPLQALAILIPAQQEAVEPMDKAELLSQFTAKVDEFARYQAFIDKAQAQAERFAPEVVAKVISSNQEKSLSVVSDLIPLTADVVDVVSGLHASRVEIETASSESNLRMQELELRLAIGELDESAFEQESADLKVELDQAQERIVAIQAEVESFSQALDRWSELGVKAGVLQGPVEVPEPQAEQPEPEPEPAPVDPVSDSPSDEDLSVEELAAELAADDAFEVDVDIVGSSDIVEIAVDGSDDDLVMEADDDAGIHVERVSVKDDVSAVFLEAGGSNDDSDDAETRNEEVLLADDVLAADDGGLEILGDDEPLELEGADEPINEIKPRRAVLLQAENTVDEQVHTVAKDVITIGRGRDNDIQVRNDSKVSRHHCKVYRRGPNYYIEDNKSANGSLVNGELITERRLFGGEEIIVGETFFRFRIMD